MQGTSKRILLAEGPTAAHQPSTVMATVWIRPPYKSGTYASLASHLSAANASAEASPVRVQGITSLNKIGIKGNGNCEIGELPAADNAGEQSGLCNDGCHCNLGHLPKTTP